MLIFSTFTKRVHNLLVHIEFIRKYSTKMEKDDNRLETFKNICDQIAAERSYIKKSKILHDFLKKGSDKSGFKGDTLLWIQLLLPDTSQRVYNLRNKQLLKLFSRLFACNQEDMQHDLEQEGDISETLSKFFGASPKLKPQLKSTLYLQEVDEFLLNLEKKTKEDEQSDALRQLCKRTTADDLKMIIRFINQDLRINAGARHILDAFGPFAYPVYQSSHDLAAVVQQFTKKNTNTDSFKIEKKIGKPGQIVVMTPISPMLANACKSVEEAFKKNPSGLYCEIKYDGERVQIHKRGKEFKFFSRNLKPVMDHKVKRLKESISKAFPDCGDMVLDSEIIMVDTVTGELLPFGTLGVQKRKEYVKAEVCLFVFDCILFNGSDLTDSPFRERRKILEDNITPIKSFVQLSESHFLKSKNELASMMAKVLKANLEGVVLKSPASKYQPGKRNWLKVKKDYLFDGQMADTADLVVLGGNFGSGKKGGILSIFLMGCYDRSDGLWKTVTKVHGGLDDATQEDMHEKLMKLMVRSDPNNLPNWLLCKKTLIPDYIAKTPTEMPVWEIRGAEFTKSEGHTAAGISIRFPRITRLRDDKSAEDANDMEYLQKLYDASKSDINVDLLITNCKDNDSKMEKAEGVEIETKCSNDDAPPMKRSSAELEPEAELPTSSKKVKMTTVNELPYVNGKLMKADDNKQPTTKTMGTTPKNKNMLIRKKEKQLKLNFSPISKKPAGAGSTSVITSPTTSTSISSSTGASTSTITSASTCTVASISASISTDANASTNANYCTGSSEVFKNVVAYFDVPAVDSDKYRTLLSMNGGTVTENAKEATIALHSSTDLKVDLDACRKKYATNCRHLSVNWVSESVAAQKCVDFPLYAVILK